MVEVWHISQGAGTATIGEAEGKTNNPLDLAGTAMAITGIINAQPKVILDASNILDLIIWKKACRTTTFLPMSQKTAKVGRYSDYWTSRAVHFINCHMQARHPKLANSRITLCHIGHY